MIYRLKWDGPTPEGGKVSRKSLPTAIVATSRAQMFEFLAEILKATHAVSIPRRVTITAAMDKKRRKR